MVMFRKGSRREHPARPPARPHSQTTPLIQSMNTQTRTSQRTTPSHPIPQPDLSLTTKCTHHRLKRIIYRACTSYISLQASPYSDLKSPPILPSQTCMTRELHSGQPPSPSGAPHRPPYPMHASVMNQSADMTSRCDSHRNQSLKQLPHTI